MRLSGEMLAAATGGVWHGEPPRRITGISTDSRHLRPGQAFLALRGPRFDGHRFAAEVAGRAAALIGDAEGMRGWASLDAPKLEVRDTLEALGRIAHAWREQLTHTQVIAISGSCGKTGLRSMLEHGLRRLGFRVAATQANLNNLIGVPLTLLGVPQDADIALIECGISERGEMARLAGIVAPDGAVLTTLASAHGEGLGDLAGITREKALLLEPALQRGGWIALGERVADRLAAAGALPETGEILRLDAAEGLAWTLETANGESRCLLRHKGRHTGQPAAIRLPLPARHWAHNLALAALVIERIARAPLDRIARSLEGWQPPAGRLQPQRLPSGAWLLDDSYNANPASMQAALDTLRALEGVRRRIAILGDMAELGAQADAAHRGLDVAGIGPLWLIGPHMRALAAQNEAAETRWFADADAALAALDALAPAAGDAVLVKASRAMRLDRIADALRGREAAHAV